MKCDLCGFNDTLPFKCKFCGNTYCYRHHLPESHNCSGHYKRVASEEWLQNSERSKEKILWEWKPSTNRPPKVPEKYKHEYIGKPHYFKPKNNSFQRLGTKVYYKQNKVIRWFRKYFIGLVFCVILFLLLLNSSKNNFNSSPQANGIEATPIQITQQNSIEELRNYSLELINEDRKKYGLNPVVLGNNNAAQLHAEDMLKNRFLSHWGSDGSKPYMRYTKEGGRGGVAENAAFSGFFYYEPNAATIEPKEAIKEHEYSMMYDDASSNWGHRDNIIDKNHNKVNIGIAYDNTNLAYVQDFEDDYISWSEPIAYSSGALSMSGTTSLGIVDSVALYYDPLPQPLSHSQLLDSEHSGAYKLGDEVGYIVQPSYFIEGTKYVNAYQWSVSNSGSFSISANIQPLLYKGKGVYTGVIWAKKENEGIPLTTYSINIS